MMTQIDKRIRALEAAGSRTDDAYVTLDMQDGTVQRMLWADAMLIETGVVDVHGSELAGLVKGFLLSSGQDSSK